MLRYNRIGEPHLHFKEVDSTNAVAKRHIDKNIAPEGMLITADTQTEGRGQYGRTWVSDERLNVLMSVILKPTFLPISNQFDLNIIVSLTVADVLKKYCPVTKIKWPNDIYVGDQKIAGILIQNFIQGQEFAHSIIGIGINVLQVKWPEDIPHVTSLAREGCQSIKIPEIIQTLCVQLEKRYDILRSAEADFRQEYINALYRVRQTTRFKIREEVQSGIIEGIDEIGRLKIKQNDRIHAYNHGEIKLVI